MQNTTWIKVALDFPAAFPIYFLALFCCSFPSCAAGQNTQAIDSLKEEIARLPQDSTKALLYDEISWQLLNIDKREALKYADSTIWLSEKLNFPKGIVKGMSNKGGYHYMMGELDMALAFYEKCDSLSRAHHYGRGVLAANSNIANILYQQGDFREALEKHGLSLKWGEAEKDTLMIIKALINLSAVYNGMGDYENQIGESLKAIQLLETQNEEQWMLGTAHNNLCACFHETHDFEKAVPHCQKAIEIFKEYGQFVYLPAALFTLGDAYTLRGERDKALAVLREGFTYNPRGKTLYYGNAHLGGWFFAGNQFDSSLHYYQMAHQVALETGLKHEAATSAFNIGQCFWRKQDPKKAYSYFKAGIEGLERLPGNQLQLAEGYKEYLLLKAQLGHQITPAEMERYIGLRDSVFSESKLALLNEIETKYQTRLKQDSIEALEVEKRLVVSERDRSRQLAWLFAILAALLVCLSGLLYYFFRLKKMQSQRLAEGLETLKSANLVLKDSLIDKEKQLVSPAFLAQQPITLTNREKTVLLLGDILYIKAERGAVQVFTAGKNYWDWQLLKHYAAILPEGLFVQSHKSYLVNRLHVKELKATTLSLSNGSTLKVGKTYRENLQAALLLPSENG